MDQPACFNCRFFAPNGHGHNDLTEEQWDECLEGECRRRCPTLGQMLVDRHGDEFRHFGEWPKVLAGDWCGCFEPKSQPSEKQADSPPTLARGAPVERSRPTLRLRAGANTGERGPKEQGCHCGSV